MNILEAILSAQGGAPVRQMGARVGVDEGQAQSALESLLLMLAGAVNRNATQPGGLLDMLTPMLGRNRDGSALDDILGMASQFLGKR